MEVTQVDLEKAIMMQQGNCAYNMPQLRGAIRTLMDEAGYKNEPLKIPLGETAQSWMNKLVIIIEAKNTLPQTNQ